MIVTPIISDSITTATGITGNAVSVTAEIGKDITADAEIVRSIVSVSGEVTKIVTAEAELTTHVSFGDYDYYSGAVEVTPSAEAQTLFTSGKVVLNNITINPRQEQSLFRQATRPGEQSHCLVFRTAQPGTSSAAKPSSAYPVHSPCRPSVRTARPKS